jgi:hypothetical protein
MKFYKIKHPLGGAKRGPKDANIQYFNGDYEEKIDILVRETIQNPLDHPLGDEPVKILFRQRYVETNEIPNRDELLNTMKALKEKITAYKESDTGIAAEFESFYSRAVKSLENKQIGILQISDYNTTGLTGSRADLRSDIGRFLGGVGWWDDSSTGGGSGGLGKFAPFRFSGVNFCLYSSFNTDGEYIFYGWGTNFYHEMDGTAYTGEMIMGEQAPSDYDVLKQNLPFGEGFLSERESELGTDVFALDFIKDKQGTVEWGKEMTRAVIRNFFGAIIEGNLIVEIDEYNKGKMIVDQSTINDHMDLFKGDLFTNGKDYLADGYTVEAVKCYLDGMHITSEDVETPILGECYIKILQDDEASRHFTFMRGPRMLIKSEKIRTGDLGFSGVFVCNSESGNRILRRLEDSHHKDWKYESSEDKKVRKEIMDFVKRVVEQVAKFDSPDEFTISGSRLLSIGSTTPSDSGSGNSEGEQLEEAAVMVPKNVVKTNIPSSSFGGLVKVDKNGKKKGKKPKRERYKKPNEGGNITPTTKKKREFRVDDFKAVIFKNDENPSEYHLFIEAPEITNIRTISFDVLGGNDSLKDVSFIDSVSDSDGNQLTRDTRPGLTVNSYENFYLQQGRNKFIVKTKFNKKVQIIIN